MTYQHLGCLAVRRHQIDNAGRKAGRFGGFGNQICLKRRFGRRLHDHRATGQQRGRDLVDHDGQRRIPRCDGGDHTHRLTRDDGGAFAVRWSYRFGKSKVAKASVIAQQTQCPAHHVGRNGGQRAYLPHPGVRQFAAAQCQRITHLAQQLGALYRAQRWPRAAVKGAPRGSHRVVHVLRRRFGHRGKGAIVARRDHIDVSGQSRRHPAAIDEQPVGVAGADGRGCSSHGVLRMFDRR